MVDGLADLSTENEVPLADDAAQGKAIVRRRGLCSYYQHVGASLSMPLPQRFDCAQKHDNSTRARSWHGDDLDCDLMFHVELRRTHPSKVGLLALFFALLFESSCRWSLKRAFLSSAAHPARQELCWPYCAQSLSEGDVGFCIGSFVLRLSRQVFFLGFRHASECSRWSWSTCESAGSCRAGPCVVFCVTACFGHDFESKLNRVVTTSGSNRVAGI